MARFDTACDIDLAHEADMRALRRQQLADDIDLDGEICSGCSETLRGCRCCEACGCVISRDHGCGCPEDLSEEDERDMMALYLDEIDAEIAPFGAADLLGRARA